MKRFCSFFLAVAVFATALCAAPGVRPQAEAAGKKLIAFTFDDGPGPYTERLLDGLKARGVKATFFMLGSRAQTYSSTAARVYREGHQVANHSYDHPELTALSDQSVKNQIQSTNNYLTKACGGSGYVVRPPYGSVNQRVKAAIGAPVVLWSVDTRDWQVLNANTVTNNILRDSFDGAIVLMHDIYATSVDGALSAIDTLKSRGYEFVTVRELFRRRGRTMKNGEVYDTSRPNGKDLGAVQQPAVTDEAVGGKLQITITAQKGADIYYTVDGSDPAVKGKKYSGPFFAETPCRIKSVAAFHLNGSRSDTVETAITTPTAATPELQIENGVLSLSCATEEAEIHYTTDGTEAAMGSPLYQGPVTLSPGTVVSACAGGETLLTGKTVRGTYSSRGNFVRDVFPNQWFYESVDTMLSRGIMSGTGNHRFEPRADVTRGQLVTILYQHSQEQAGEEALKAMPFADVKQGRYYFTAVAWAYEKHIVSGYSAREFRPEQSITREEMSQILSAYLADKEMGDEQEISLEYGDLEKISRWALPAVKRVCALGLFHGDEKGNFAPKAKASRAEAACVITKLCELTD